MASFSTATRELVLKLVYYGPGLGGKTTTLKALHSGVRAEHRGKMVSLTTPVDRTLYFDFLPVRLPSIGDVQLRLQLFTVPGQVYFNATRKLVLTGADGIVFVADSQFVRLDANIESLDNLRANLVELGRDFEKVPLVLAFNKRDLPDTLPVDELDRELNSYGFPSLPTAAQQGRGVFETLDAVVRLVFDDLHERRVIPSDITVPHDGIIAERLSDVRTSEPSNAEPARIISGDSPRAPSEATEVTVREPAAMIPASTSAATGTVTLTGTVAGMTMSMSTGSVSVDTRSTAVDTAGPSADSLGQKVSMRRAPSLMPLFNPEDHEAIRTIEDAMSGSILPRAILLLEALMVRVLQRTAQALGRTDASHEAVGWTLGLAPECYARLRAAAQRARHGAEVSRRDVLEAYVTVANAQVAAERLTR